MIIDFQQVTKKYGIINALDDVSFKVDHGDFIFIIGSSGAGKSTIVKLILHQICLTSGKILIDDQNISLASKKEIEKIRRSIGVIFQDYQLIPDKSVEENIALCLDINQYPSADIPRRIDEVLKMVNLETRKFLFPAQLSGGELQRAVLARALSTNPKLILADEPTGNLDPENSWNLINLLLDINLKQGTTIIMTTHNREIIKSLNKRVLTIDCGHLVNDSQLIPVEIPQKPIKKVKKITRKHHD
ncbi:MAG: ATP-binding cassette domain-containing protein [Candidatus Shapirobacteria bacterium]|nr:ATP-binding cassette domain-containing protein [Candidatus Shapirobacteria bacterium]